MTDDVGNEITMDTDAPEHNRGRRKTDGRSKKNPNMKRSGEPKHSKSRIESAEQQAKALEARKAGFNYEQIAKLCDYNSAQAAWNAVESALKRVLQEPAEDVRKLESERLDALYVKPFQQAKAGDMQALNSALAIMGRRARLLGLDAPVKTDNKTELNTGGVFVIGPVMTPEAWDAAAQAQQAGVVAGADQADHDD